MSLRSSVIVDSVTLIVSDFGKFALSLVSLYAIIFSGSAPLFFVVFTDQFDNHCSCRLHVSVCFHNSAKIADTCIDK